MILSMTGFGDAETFEDGVRYRVEIRSVNNRYFKSSIKLPELFQSFEVEVDKLLRARLGRGSVMFSLRMKDETAATAHEINKAALKRYMDDLRTAVGEHHADRIDPAILLNIPGVLQPPTVPESVLEERFESIRALTASAIDRLIEMRRKEGESILADLERHGAVIRARVGDIEGRSPAVVTEYAKRLHSRVQMLMSDGLATLDQDALAREVAIFAERCDVNEEVSRLSSHLDQFAELCRSKEEAGRKLDFLTQEMLREANTTGSKANDAEITRHVVEIKAAIDRIKEQVQNVE